VQIALILLAMLAFLALYFYNCNYLDDDFRPGTAIAGIAVAGSDRNEARLLLDRQMDQIYNTPVVFAYEDEEEKLELQALLKPVDLDQVVTSAWEADRSQSCYQILTNAVLQRTVNYPLPLVYDSAATDDLLDKWNEKWGTPFHDARLEMDAKQGLIVIPGQIGMTVDRNETFKILPTAMQSIPASISGEIVMARQNPKIGEEALQHMGEIAKYSTRYNPNEVNRTHNLTKATQGINGSIILPGEVFSFNQTVGRRTMETGYKDAMVIVNGKFEPGLGGGICQVSSTLYNASLLAGLEIVERHNHNLTVAYVPLGQDATVSYGTQDFKFRNSTTSPVYVRAAAGGGNLTVNIYGDTHFKQKIEISNIIDQSTPYQTVTLPDNSLQPGETKLDHNGQNGYVVRSFRIFFDQNGEKSKSESLGRSVYIPLHKTILAGPALEEQPPAEGTEPTEGTDPGEGTDPAEGIDPSEEQDPDEGNGSMEEGNQDPAPSPEEPQQPPAEPGQEPTDG